MAIRRGRAAGGFLREFQEFALKGNVVDLAVAVIIGGAFGKIVTSFVEDIVMPGIVNPILSQSGADWREATIGPGIAIGRFFGAIVDFLIIAFIIFLAVRAIEQARRRFFREDGVEEAPADPVVASQERLTTSIDRLTQTLDRRGL